MVNWIAFLISIIGYESVALINIPPIMTPKLGKFITPRMPLFGKNCIYPEISKIDRDNKVNAIRNKMNEKKLNRMISILKNL